MTELDKFKRRLIRSVARLLLHEKRPDEEVWEQLQKETGCDCKLLWNRMRALTIKKLNRLLSANDQSKQLAAVARLSLTDWLFFDLVLVHENIDLLGQDDPAPLSELLELVQKYSIESLPPGDKLVDAWTKLTVNYNTNDRQCSPMLLQKRWYQLKEVTRNNFYHLWYSYRGNHKLWETASQNAPSVLQMAVAKKFPQVITKPFLDWQQTIAKGLVVMPHQFQDKLKKPAITSEDQQELIVIEPEIETIDLRLDSDSDEATQDVLKISDSATSIPQNKNTVTSIHNLDKEVKIKQESLEFQDGLSNVQILATTHIPETVLDESSNSKDRLSPLTIEAEKVLRKQILASQMSKFMETTQTLMEPIGCEKVSNIDKEVGVDYLPDQFITENVNKCIQSQQETLKQNETVRVELITESANDGDEFVEDEEANELIQAKAEEYCKKIEIKVNKNDKTNVETDDFIKAKMYADEYVEKMQEVLNDSEDDLIKVKADDFIKNKEVKSKSVLNPLALDCNEALHDEDFVDDIIKQKADDFVRKTDIKKLVTNVVKEFELPVDMDIIDDGIEFIDDGIEYIEDDDNNNTGDNEEESHKEKIKPITDIKIESETLSSAGKIDLKLLMVPVVYTTKLDTISVLANKPIDSVEGKDIIEEVLKQSKPVGKKSMKVEQIEKLHTRDIVQEEVDIPEEDVNVFENNSQSDESDEEVPISEDQKVKPTSYLLQKPRSRSYNPIQLCKNPDFNTRLKRLTVGFFTSTRNCRLLKACMPLTVDLHKAFESKLIEGTLYLKSNDAANVPVQIETKEDDHSEQATVLPSAMPIQCLMDATVPFSKLQNNDTMNTVDLTSKCGDDVLVRNKVINLRDLSEIRLINQRLLTAEVSPIPLDSEAYTSTVPISQAPFEMHDAQQVNDKCQNEYDNAVPSSSLQTESFITHSNNELSTSNDNNADNNLLVESHSRNVRGTGHFNRGRGRGGRGRGRGGKPGPKSLTRYPTKVSFNFHRPPNTVSVPWNKPRKVISSNESDDFLITIDTLNKMINKMNGSDLYIDPSKKNKKPNWVLEDKEDETVVKNKEEEKQDLHKEEPPCASKNENTVQKDLTPPREVQIQKKTVVEKKPREKRPPRTNQKVYYCCWCKEKLYKLETKSRVRQKHMCSVRQQHSRVLTCECCCRFELAEALSAIGKRMNKVLVPSNDDAIVLSDEEDFSAKSISAPTPVIRVVTVESMAKRKFTSISSQVGNTLSGKQGEVNAAVDSILSNITSPTLSNTNQCSSRGLHLTVGAVTAGDGESICSVPVVSRVESTPELFAQDSVSHIQETTALSQSPPVSPVSAKKKVTIWPLNKKQPIVLKRPLLAIKPKDCNTLPKCYTVVSNSKSLQQMQVKNDERVLLLSSKKIVGRKKKYPIFLGKNKILLSTVRMPRENDTAKFELPLPLPPQETRTEVVPTLSMPQGVQLVLMPSGEVTYTIEPGVTLTEEELLVIPNVISIVQQQLAHQIQPVPSMPTAQEVQSTELLVDNANLVQNMAPENQTILENNQLSSQDCIVSNLESAVNDSESQTIVAALTTVVENNSNEQTMNLDDSSVSHKEIDTASILNDSTGQAVDANEQENISSNISKGSDTSIKDIPLESEKRDESISSVSNRNLLSELMEMSGISAADTLPAPQNSVAVGGEGTVEMIPETIAEHAPSEVVDLTAVRTTSNLINMPELTPISSLSELKYACDYNAQFFKLDLDTGIVVPINVAIKKNLKTKGIPITKSIIDLTDDGDDDTAITVSNIKNNDLSYQVSSDVMNKIPDVSFGVKPLKLFKAIRKIKASDLTVQLKATPSTIASSARKRKQCFDRSDPSINLVDSEAHMEEEHLLNSTNDEDTSSPKKTRKAIPQSVTSKTDNFDDSSDDEPLAVISKKMKAADICNKPTEESATGKNPEKESGNLNDKTEKAIIKNPVQKTTESIPSLSSEATDSQDEIVIEDGDVTMDTEEDTFLEEIEDNDSQEDCILGV